MTVDREQVLPPALLVLASLVPKKLVLGLNQMKELIWVKNSSPPFLRLIFTLDQCPNPVQHTAP